MAVVCGVIAASIFSGSRFSVTGSTSANTGFIPFHSRECDVATKEYGVVMTSPVTRNACKAVTKAIVPLVNKQICFTPRKSHSACSSSRWNGPPLVRILFSHICSKYGINSSRGGRNGWVTKIGLSDTLVHHRFIRTDARDGSRIQFDHAVTAAKRC